MKDFENLSRQQRRHIERQIRKLSERVGFSREEVDAMNGQAYELGKEIALDAAKEALGLGEIRLSRVKKLVTEFEVKRFSPYAALEEGGKKCGK